MRRNRRLLHAVCVLLLLSVLLPVFASAAETDGKTVRVGWHEAPYFIEDPYGRWSGYSYDYQCRLVAYTGWTYEYVKGSWSELLQMLLDGEIDLLSDVSYLEERAEQILYSDLPMGTDAYYIFVSPDDTTITEGDPASLNGKKVGVAKNSFQKTTFLKWAKEHDVSANLVEMSCPEEESLQLLGTELDAFVSLDVHCDSETAVPVCKIGSSDFYFAVSKSRPDLLSELNDAMSRLQDDNRYFHQQLGEQYLSNADAESFLNKGELAWLSEHGAIRVGYQDNYLAFCASDKETGELTGALKDCLFYAESALENAQLTFETTAYPTAAAAMEALEAGEVDCVFPANLTCFDCETLGVVMTPALMRTEMDAVVRAAEQKEFLRKERVVVAVNKGNTNYDMFLADRYPTWNRAYFENTPAGLEAVAAGDADCVIISNYRYNNVSKQCERLHLTTVYTGVDMDFCFAVRKGSKELYSILARAVNSIPDALVNTALTYYSTEDVKTGLVDILRENLYIVSPAVVSVLLVILLLLLRSIRAEKKAHEEAFRIMDLNKRAFVDALTSVRNKGAYNDYMQMLQDQLDRGDPLSFAIGVFDCDNLKEINDRHGHDKGDLYLKSASRLICRVFQHSPVFRFGGDEFAVIFLNEDFANLDAIISVFQQQMQAQCASAAHEWEEVHISLGIAVYDPQSDHSVGDTARRADKIMYENKRIRKAKR